MERLYSINSCNGRGYNMNFTNNKNKEFDRYIFDIESLDSLWSETIIETIPGICSSCKKDLSKYSDIDEKKKYKLLYPNESLFIYSIKNRNRYCYIYKHFCSECMNKNLYLWSIKNPKNKYPHLRVDAQSFLYNFKDDVLKKLKVPKDINFPRIYRCEYYRVLGYTYLDDSNIIYNEEQIENIQKLKYIDNCDLDFNTF